MLFLLKKDGKVTGFLAVASVEDAARRTGLSVVGGVWQGTTHTYVRANLQDGYLLEEISRVPEGVLEIVDPIMTQTYWDGLAHTLA